MSTSRRKPYPTEEPVTAQELLEHSPFDGDLDAELAARPEGRRMSRLTLVLGAGVVLVVGMLAGIQAHKTWGGSTSDRNTALQGLLAGGGAQRTGGARAGYPGGQSQGTGAPQGNGAFGNMTVGTVKLVDGGKIYLQTPDGATVTVTTTDDTKIQISKEGKVKDLKPGSTVSVRGTPKDDGSVSATSVNQGGGLGVRGGG